jgi:hypothetical protein
MSELRDYVAELRRVATAEWDEQKAVDELLRLGNLALMRWQLRKDIDAAFGDMKRQTT